MNVLLVNTNELKPPIAPIGLLQLAAYLESRGFSVEVRDAWQELSLSGAVPRSDRRVQVLGFSIRNLDSTQMLHPRSYLDDVARIYGRYVEAFPDAITVLGGAGFSIAPVEVCDRILPDFGIAGEGEVPFAALLTSLREERSPGPLPGLVMRTGASYIAIPQHRLAPTELAALPIQTIDRAAYWKYYDNGGMASVQTKRGCSFRCSYCTYPVIGASQDRCFPAQRVVDELETFVAQGFTYFHFTDGVFNVPRRHAVDICREIIRRQLRISWHAYISPLGLDDELAGLFRDSGNDGVHLGVDSCSDRILNRMQKPFSVAQIQAACEATQRAGLDVALNVLFGSPGESMDTVRESFDFLDRIQPTAALMTQGIRVYGGTPLHRYLISTGEIDPLRPLLDPYFYISPDLPPDFAEVVRRYVSQRPFAISDVTHVSPSTTSAEGKNRLRGPCWRVMASSCRFQHVVPE